MRRASVQALAAAGRGPPRLPRPLLRERATTDTDEDVRQAAVQALAALVARTTRPPQPLPT